jgi:hypothetical protein
MCCKDFSDSMIHSLFRQSEPGLRQEGFGLIRWEYEAIVVVGFYKIYMGGKEKQGV